MNHNDIRHMLSEYIDGSLTPGEKTSAEEHLKTCPDCGNAVRELRKTVEHIRKVEDVEPPAWMTQKIMARVRAEEEKKKQGLFRRIFFPIHVKLPLETIGVLSIAVTVYFVAHDVQETKQRFPEAPVQTYSQEPAPTRKGTAKEDKAAQGGSLQRKKEALGEPGYTPPAPAAAPEPATPVEKQQALKSESKPNRSSQAAPESMQDQARAKEFSAREAGPQAPAAAMAQKKSQRFAPEEKRAATARAEMSGNQILTLVVSDVDYAAARAEDTVKEYGGKILRKESADDALSLTVTMDTASRNRFIDRLKTLGEVKGLDAVEIERKGTVIEIRIVKQVLRN